uniref:Uncharacterized protein n=1 Tax=Glossina pallidipes TaxID=7398 RepID=A0A1A9ZMR0_GLOPL
MNGYFSYPIYIRRTVAERSVWKLSASIRFVKLSSTSTAAKSAWSSKSDGRPLPGLSSKLVPRDLKRANHFLHRTPIMENNVRILYLHNKDKEFFTMTTTSIRDLENSLKKSIEESEPLMLGLFASLLLLCSGEVCD